MTGHSGGFNSPRGREFSESASDHQESVASDDDEDGDDDRSVEDGGDDADGDDIKESSVRMQSINRSQLTKRKPFSDEDDASCEIHLRRSKFLSNEMVGSSSVQS